MAHQRRLLGVRILLVDDDLDTVEALQVFLKLEGAEVLFANSALAALATLERLLPDVILSDITMPDMDGCQLIQEIRQSPRHGALPAVAISAHADAGWRARAEEAGFNAYVVKPIELLSLLDVVERLANGKPRPSAGPSGRA